MRVGAGRALRSVPGLLRRTWRALRPRLEAGGDLGGRFVVAFANSAFDAPLGLAALDGPTGVRFTNDPCDLASADAVVFHLPTLRRLPRDKPPAQVWVAWSMESIVNVPALRDDALMARFDLRMTYELDSDIPVPYALVYGRSFIDHLLHPRGPREKPDLIASFFSSPIDQSGRLAWHEALARHLPLHCYGRVGRNRSLERDDGRSTKLGVIGRHRFTLALENSIAPDYVTEKFYDPLIVGSIPVYLGAPNVEAFAPGDHCYISVNDFRGPAELAAYLRHLEGSEKELLEYHAWRSRPLRPSVFGLAELLHPQPFVRLGRRLLEATVRAPVDAGI